MKILNSLIKVLVIVLTFAFIACGEVEASINVKEKGKTEYFVGEQFNPEGFILEVNTGKASFNTQLTEEMYETPVLDSAQSYDIKINYLNGEETLSTTITINVINDDYELVIKENGKKEYLVGEKFDISNYSFEKKYLSGKIESIENSLLTVEDINFEDEKEYQVTITDGTKELMINVLVVENKIVSVEMKSQGKLQYLIGESFDVNGFELEVTYLDGTKEIIPLALEMIDFTDAFNEPGTKEITLKEYDLKIIVEVTDLRPVELVLKEPGTNVYTIGIDLDLSGYKFVVVYSDGTEKEVTLNLENVDVYQFEENATDEPIYVTVNAKYNIDGVELKTSFEVTVLSEWDYETYIGEKEAKIVIEEIIEEMDKAFPKETQEDIVFPDKNKYGYDYVIVYTTSNMDVISATGKVEPQEEDVVVTITVKIKNDYLPTEKTWDVLVKGLGPVVLRPWVETEKHIFAYFYEGTSQVMTERDAKTVDVINYCFARVNSGKLDISGLKNFAENLKLRRSTGVRVLLSVGGGGTGSLGFSDACLTQESRKVLIDSMMEVLKKYRFDGFDLDWEYPAWVGLSDSRPEDKNNFTLLCKELREAMDEYKEGLLLTSAVIGGLNIERFYDAPQLNKYLDYIHLMTYDLNNDGIASHHTNAFDGRTYSAEGAINTYHNAGFDYSKLVIGAAFYGKISKLASKTSADISVLNKAVAKDSSGKYDTKTISFTSIYETYMKDSSYVKVYDAANGAYFLTNGEYFITYDDPDAIENKMQLIKLYNIQGIMFWDYGSDQTGILLRKIESGIDSINMGR